MVGFCCCCTMAFIHKMITALDMFQEFALQRIFEIEDYLHASDALKGITKFTVVAHDPSNKDMFIVITNDDVETIKEVLDREDGK